MANYRYGAYDDGPDPLAPPYDVAEALDEMGERILGGDNPRDALRDLLRRGWQDRRGLDDLLRRVRERQRELRDRGRLDGMLDQARELLDEALGARSAARCSPTRATTPGCARPSSTRCRTTPRGPSASSPTTTGGRPRRGRSSRSCATCCAGRCSTASSAA